MCYSLNHSVSSSGKNKCAACSSGKGLEKYMENNVTPECITNLRSKYNTLGPKAAIVADYIFSHPKDVVNNSINDLARLIGVSQFSVVSCVKAAGYSGYSDFKMALALGMGQSNALLFGNTEDADNPYDIMCATLRKKARCINDTLAIIDKNSFEQAIGMILHAQRIELYGIGYSAFASEYLSMNLRRMGFLTVSYKDPRYQVMSASVLSDKDLVIAFSTSGAAVSVIEALKIAKANHCKTITVTSFIESEMVKYSDCTLLTTYSDPELLRSTNNSIVEQISISSAITLAVAHSNKPHAIEYLNRTTDAAEHKDN